MFSEGRDAVSGFHVCVIFRISFRIGHVVKLNLFDFLISAVKVKTAADTGLLGSANIEALSVRICVLHFLHPEAAKIIFPL